MSILPALLVLAGCQSSAVQSSGASDGSDGSQAAQLAGSPGKEIGITDKQVRIGVIADIQTPVSPGLFQKSVDAVKAWAEVVNASGGIAGRQIVTDVIDSKHDATASRAAIIQACERDFALVGTEALTLSDVSDIDTCKNSKGQPIGIPNLAGIATGLQQCDKNTFVVLGANPAYCKTRSDSHPTYDVQVGDYKWLASQNHGLHGVWVLNTDVPGLKDTQKPVFVAGSAAAGIGKDGEGYYGAALNATQSSLTPIVQVIKQHGSTYVNSAVGPEDLVLLRREAQLQGADSVKVWVCGADCYSQNFLKEGGDVVNGTYNTLPKLPIYSEYQSNPSLAGLVKRLGDVNNLDSNALSSYVAALLFQDAMTKAAASGTLTRQSLFDVLNQDETSFNASGIVGKTDVSHHALSPCFVIAQVRDGAWQRVYPSKVGTFDCNPSNLVAQKSSS